MTPKNLLQERSKKVFFPIQKPPNQGHLSYEPPPQKARVFQRIPKNLFKDASSIPIVHEELQEL